MAFKKRSSEEIKKEMDEFNQVILDLGENFKRDPDSIAEYLAFNTNFYQYSPKNQQLIFSQNPHASFVGSYKHFKDEGYQVQKGEKGMKIFMPVKATFFDRNGQKIPLKDATKQEKALINSGDIEVTSILRFKLASVFDIAQTDCPVENYPKLCSVGSQSEDHARVFDILKDYCEDQGFPVDSEASLRSITLRGAFSPATKKIVLNEKLEDTQKLGTFLHEMAHAFIGHNFDDYEPIQESRDEFEADGLAIMLLTRFGFEITEPMKAHLSGNFKTFLNDLKNLDDSSKENYSVDLSFGRINDVYKNHIEPMEELLDQEFQAESSYEVEM